MIILCEPFMYFLMNKKKPLKKIFFLLIENHTGGLIVKNILNITNFCKTVYLKDFVCPLISCQLTTLVLLKTLLQSRKCLIYFQILFSFAFFKKIFSIGIFWFGLACQT